MNIATLKGFCDVVEVKSYTLAAERSGVTQSAVTQYVNAVEREFGKVLRERGQRCRVDLTEVGELVYEAGREIARSCAGLEAAMESARSERAVSVRVATIESVGLYRLPGWLKALAASGPEPRVEVLFGDSDFVYEAVRNGDADLGLVTKAVGLRKVRAVGLGEERLVVICALDHAFAGRKSVTPAEVRREALVGFEGGQPAREQVDGILRSWSRSPGYVAEFGSVELIKRAVEIGLGVAVVPEPTVEREVRRGSLVSVQLGNGKYSRRIWAVHRRWSELSLMGRALLDVAKGS